MQAFDAGKAGIHRAIRSASIGKKAGKDQTDAPIAETLEVLEGKEDILVVIMGDPVKLLLLQA